MTKKPEEKKEQLIKENAERVNDLIDDLIATCKKENLLSPAAVAYFLARGASSLIHRGLREDLDNKDFIDARQRSLGLLQDGIFAGQLEDLRTRNDVMEQCISLHEQEKSDLVED